MAQLAQLVEQRTENPRVSGSIPELGIYYKKVLTSKCKCDSISPVDELTQQNIVHAGVVQW